MEKSANIEDQVMDNLLRSYIKQQKQPEINCDGFDPDLANLYLERVLTEKETGRYEIHLSECSPCRSSVVALAHFAEQEVPLALVASVKETQAVVVPNAGETKAVEKSNANWLQGLKGFFALLMIPRYALGAVAALVLAVSIPLVLSQRNNKSSNSPDNTASAAKSVEGDSAPDVLAKASPMTSNDGFIADSGSAEARSKEQQAQFERDRAASPESTHQSASGQAGANTGAVAGDPPASTAVAENSTEKKEVAKNDSTTVADNKPRTDESPVKVAEPPPVAAPPPVARAAEKKELPRIESKDVLKIQNNDNDAPAKTLKPGTSDGAVASITKPTGPTIRPNEGVRPPASSTESGGRGLTDKSKSLRSASDVRKEPARASASRKIDNKTFWLIDDVWTDKDYKKDKELPVVTLTKESDVYKEVLEKHSNLQKFFQGFAAGEKVIVVYKGTVYRLMPR